MTSLLKKLSSISFYLVVFFIGIMTAQSETIKPGTTYGPVTKTDTLWSIARNVEKEKHININQVILAISQNNPKAFVKTNNIHALRKDAYLKIPSSEEIAAISKQEAYQFIVAQNKPTSVLPKKTWPEKNILLNISSIKNELNRSEQLLNTLKIKDPEMHSELLKLQRETATLLEQYQQQL